VVTVWLLDEIAEKRIREAVEQGQLEHLPGEGKPLRLDDDSMVPESLRAAYRLLRNANCLPPELVQRREIRRLEDLLAAIPDDDPAEAENARDARRRLVALQTRVAAARGDRSPLWADPAYRNGLLKRLSQSDR
jgi:hypothetical protein